MVVIMAGLLLIVGYYFGELFMPGHGDTGLLIAFALWLLLTLVSYFSGDKIFLAISGARKIGAEEHPILYNVVEEMKIASGLPKMPDIYIIDDDAPNAFATGRKPETASVAVTAGLLKIMTRDELQGVIAHEMGHVKNRDVLYMMIAGVMMGTIVLLADIGARTLRFGGMRRTSSRGRGGGQAQAVILLVAILLMILAPIVAQLLYFSISRRREYLADASSAIFTRYPEGLASALEKISRTPLILHAANRATAPMYIVNPLRATGVGLTDLTSTHPPTSERIRILRSMAGGAGLATYNEAFRKVTGRPVGVVPPSAVRIAPQVAVSGPRAAAEPTPAQRARQATDALWKLNGYAFLTCGCGVKLKVPPSYSGKDVACPRCGRAMTVPAAAAK